MTRSRTITATAAHEARMSNQLHRSARTHAFTLVELLVVVSIIAVLAALLMPAITMIQRSAKQTNCASNLHQLAIATLSYVTDNQTLPIPVDSNHWSIGNAAGGPVGVMGPPYLVQTGFLESFGILYCPGVGRRGIGRELWLPNNWNDTYTSYCWWAGYTYTGSPTPSNIMLNANDPAGMLMASDFASDASATAFSSNHALGLGPTARGGNLVFNDGHVTWKKFTDMQLQQDFYMKFYF